MSALARLPTEIVPVPLFSTLAPEAFTPMTALRLTLHPTAALALAYLAITPLAHAEDAVAANRYKPLAGFRVEEVVTPESTGSLVAMAFDEQGRMIASRERVM